MVICKTSLFLSTLDIVSEQCEIAKSVILSKCKTTEAVDARSILVHVLIKQGFYINDIARLMGITPQGVGVLRNGFEQRKLSAGKIFEINYQQILNKLKSIQLGC